jgi:RHS repeat-associated protein
MMAWIKIPSSFQCPANNVAKNVVGKGNDYGLGVTCANGQPRVSIAGHYPGQATYGNGFGQHTITPNVWHHIAMTWVPKSLSGGGAVTTYYYDGQWDGGSVWNGPEANPGLSNDDPNVTIGCFSAAVYWMRVPFQGLIDEVAIYGRPMPAAELASVYSATSNVQPTCKYPVIPEIADCVGKSEGAICTHGKWCADNNVCHNGVCGGSDPADAICLRMDGVVQTAPGKFTAVFGSGNPTSAPIVPTTNIVRQDGVTVLVPNPRPPEWIPAGQRIGLFRPSFSANQEISWQVNGQAVRANAGSYALTPVHVGSGISVEIEGESLSIVPDLGEFAEAPDDPGLQGEPAWSESDAYKGTLKGQLTVSPLGAAIYTLPISIPQGIAGMAPSLNLVYSSQGQDGIAGEGWDLSGFSNIYRCPKTLAKDGYTRQVSMLAYDPTVNTDEPPQETDADGICLDGKRLYRQADGTYASEVKDMSTIWRDPERDPSLHKGIRITTKEGQTRFYGTRADSRAVSGSEIAVWALDRVVDAWGNYYDITYNQGAGGVWQELLPTNISYTGHLRGEATSESNASDAAIEPFYSVKLSYEDRPDVRNVRFGPVYLEKKKRLTTIETKTGTYSLAYVQRVDPMHPTAAELMLPSQLQSVTFCAAAGGCLDPLVFDWEGGGYGWDSVSSFAPPTPIDREVYDPSVNIQYGAFGGSVFVDLNGDGREDFVHAFAGSQEYPNGVWENTGAGWAKRDDWALPNPSWIGLPPLTLSKGDGKPEGTIFADVDGDGLSDIVSNYGSGTVCQLIRCSSCQSYQDYTCDVYDENGVNCQICGRRIPGLWLNNIKDGGGWSYDEQPLAPPNVKVDFASTHTMADMDGDGRADIVQLKPHFAVMLRNVDTWIFAEAYELPSVTSGAVLKDVDRDGRVDVSTQNFVYLNTGNVQNGTVWKLRPYFPGSDPGQLHPDPAQGVAPGRAAFGDIDGDGRQDSIVFEDFVQDHPTNCSNLGVQYGRLGATFSTGLGYGPATKYSVDLATYLPKPFEINTCNTFAKTWANLADLNADGLVDVVIGAYPYNLNSNNPGQVLINTGSGWSDAGGASGWQRTPNPQVAIPIGPSPYLETEGRTFLDFDGNGVMDVVGNPATGGSQAWRNRFSRPVIKKFPNGLAAKTEVSYSVITTKQAKDDGVYTNDGVCNRLKTCLAVPLRVTSSVSTDDGLGSSQMKVVRYSYDSLRGNPVHGPQGFRRIKVTDETSGAVTTTDYSQNFPYTGLPTHVTKELNHTTVGETTTTYCDGVAEDTHGVPICTPASGGDVAPQTSVFIYPRTVVDVSVVWGDSGPASITTTTEFRYDEHNNVKSTSVTTEGTFHGVAEKSVKTTVNTYDSADSRILSLGRPTKVVVTTSRIMPDARSTTRTTEYSYEDRNHFDLSPTGDSGTQTLALATTTTERNNPEFASRAAYAYDRFGNVITTTVCTDDLDDCAPNAQGPADHPNRTISVSFDPSDGVSTNGVGTGSSTDPELRGRFPIRTTNAVGEVSYSFYDSSRGGLLTQKIAVDGERTCYEHDSFGFRQKETARCGLLYPQATTFRRYRTAPGDGPRAKVVTVMRAPNNVATWKFTDIYDRVVETRGRTFDGGFWQQRVVYDRQGRESVGDVRPRKVVGDSYPIRVTQYDDLGRLKAIFQQLGDIDGTGGKSTTISYSYPKPGEVQATQEVSGRDQIRIERRNSLGKIVETEDAGANKMKYSYDAEGILTDTWDPAGNRVHIDIDRGRKKGSVDPDLGSWHYFYDGFGELVRQVDAHGNVTTMSYDRMGRVTSRTDGSGTAYWLYNAGGGSDTGRLAATISAPDSKLQAPCAMPAPFAGLTGNRAVKTYSYTDKGEIQSVSECVDGETFTTTHHYDDRYARQDSVTYPEIQGEQLTLGYHYTQLGFLHYVTEGADGPVYWAATAMNGAGELTGQKTRNGVESTFGRNQATGWLMSSKATSHARDNDEIQNWSHHYSETGNLVERTRVDSLTMGTTVETLDYDDLNRLTRSAVEVSSSGFSNSESFVYSNLGNMDSKAGVIYDYTGCGGRPHAVCRIGSGALFEYDDVGNLKTDGVRTIGYLPNNKVEQIVAPTGAVQFSYDADGNRVIQQSTGGASPDARTTYVGLGDTGRSLYERTTRADGIVEHVQFLHAGSAHGGAPFAIRIKTVQSPTIASDHMRYYHTDHLGSVTAMSDENGDVAGGQGSDGHADSQVFGYDPWGARRNPDGSPSTVTWALQSGHREFTGHETIPGVGLVNMNGRVYDPRWGRFLSPDPTIQFDTDLQGFNRYSYALNNPLRYVDPTGYSVLPGYGDKIVGIGIAVVGAAVCAGTEGMGCAIAFIALSTWYQSLSMATSGASWQQIIKADALSVAVSLVGGAVGGAISGSLGDGLGAKIVGGVVSDFALKFYSGPIIGEDLGWNVLEGAATAAASGAIEYSVGQMRVAEADMAILEQGSGHEAGEVRVRRWDVKIAAARSDMSGRRSTLIAYGDPPRMSTGDMTFDGVLTPKNTPSFEAGLKAALGATLNEDLSGATIKRIKNFNDFERAVSAGRYDEVIYYGHAYEFTVGKVTTVHLDPGGGSISSQQWAAVLAKNHVSTTVIAACESNSFAISVVEQAAGIRAAGLIGDRHDSINGNAKSISKFVIENETKEWQWWPKSK